MSGCTLCPRMCGADRENGKTGFFAERQGRSGRRERRFICGRNPVFPERKDQGRSFFTGCTLRCVFCQNHEIAGSKVGKVISEERLAEIFLELQGKGANNINLVTPTHFVPQIIRALQSAKKQGMYLPVVYNTGGYERVETLKMLDGLVDIYLPDFKYLNTDHAQKIFDGGGLSGGCEGGSC